MTEPQPQKTVTPIEVPEEEKMERLVSLCKRRGFIFPSSEIYGGINGCWDYGPLGVALKNNVKARWWKAMTQLREDIEGIDSSILMHPRVWEASGHVEGFSDPMVDCKECKKRFRADELAEPKCPACGGELTEPRNFNLMFKTFLGPVEDEANTVYLRPETAQGIFVNFHNVAAPSRQKVPFGIAQIGKAFRNEINPRNFTFRSREFEQMEMQFFVKPGTDGEWFEHWREERLKWHREMGIGAERLDVHPHSEKELAHYARAAVDIRYQFPFGIQEVEGIHNRGDYDLLRHQEFSGKDLTWFDDESRERYLPLVIETSIGVDRFVLACLADAYREEQVGKEKRTVMGFSPKVAPYQAAVFPLVNRDGMPEIASEISADLRNHYGIFLDAKGAIGRRYRRQDEAGTPFAITVDSQTREDRTVTLRDRNSLKQVRVKIDELVSVLQKCIDGGFSDLH